MKYQYSNTCTNLILGFFFRSWYRLRAYSTHSLTPYLQAFSNARLCNILEKELNLHVLLLKHKCIGYVEVVVNVAGML